MPLRGTVQSFPPSEILQFLTHSQKTGILRVYDDTDTKLLAFRAGRLCYALHRRQLPPVREILLYRGLVEGDEPAGTADGLQRRDDAVSRALERRRNLSEQGPESERKVEKVHAHARDARLRHVLLAQGRLTEDELSAATDPAGIPDSLLAAILRGAKLVPAMELEQLRASKGEDRCLLERVLDHKLVTREEIIEAVSRITDDSLAEMLVRHGVLSRAEVRHWLSQLEALRDGLDAPIRIGEYLVATGKIPQGQLERVLWEQLVKDKPIGEILVALGAITEEDLNEALVGIELLRGDFGPLYPLRERLQCTAVTAEGFSAAVREHETTGRSLGANLVASGVISAEDMGAAIADVLVDELCDLLLWSNAAFDFLEGFSLDDALPRRDLPEVHGGSFEVAPLLLSAHAIIDELNRTEFRDLVPSMVLVPVEPEDEVTVDGAARHEILAALDGRRSMGAVCRLLPGNRLQHFRTLAELLSRDLVRPLTRAEAYVAGQEALSEDRLIDAVTLFEHALESPGDAPPSSRLHIALRDAHWSTDRRPLMRALLATKYASMLLAQLPAFRAALRWMAHSRGFSSAGRGVRRVGMEVRAGVMRTVVTANRLRLKARLWFEQVSLRTGMARHLWGFKAGVANWFGRVPGMRRLSLSGGVVSVGAAVAVLAVFLTGGTPDVSKEESAATLPGGVGPADYRSSMPYFESGGPVYGAPVLDAERIYFSSRDGSLRALRKTSPVDARDGTGDLELLWELGIGEFGDVLSQPLIASGQLFLTNVRGHAFAVSSDGDVIWKQAFRRLEPMAPAPLHDAEGALRGIAVVSRESVMVLAPEDGRVVYQLQTGNRVLATPIGDAGTVVVGSADNHVYAADWRRGEIVWEHEETDDIIALVRSDDYVVLATRDGSVTALDWTSGAVAWKRTTPRDSVRRMDGFGQGRVYVETSRRRIEVLDTSTGRTENVFLPDPRFEVARLRLHDNRGLFVSEGGFLGELRRNGSLLWRSEVPVGEVTGWAQGDGFIAVANRAGHVILHPAGPVKRPGGPR